MRSLLALAFALLPAAAGDAPAPPPAGSGAHVASTLVNEMAVRFSAAGHVLRTVQQRVEEKSKFTISVVAKLGDGLEALLKPADVARLKKGELELETPRTTPPHVRMVYDKCTASVEHGEHGAGAPPLEYETSESLGLYFLERGAPDADPRTPPPVRQLFANFGGVNEEVAQRVAIDADAFLVGPRLAPLVLGKELAADAPLEVAPALLGPLLQQAVAGGTVTKATLRPRGSKASVEGGVPDRLAFKIAVAVEWKGGEELPVAATFTLEGELELVQATAQVSALLLSGPIAYSGKSDQNGAQLEITGSGKLSFEYHAEPLAKQEGK